MTEKKIRVVIADDEEQSLRFMKAAMEILKYEVAGEAANGDEAIDLFIKKQPDILFLDTAMYAKTGLEVLKNIKSIYPDAFIIMMKTSEDVIGSTEKFLDLGAVNCIKKDTPILEMCYIIKETWENFNKQSKKT